MSKRRGARRSSGGSGVGVRISPTRASSTTFRGTRRSGTARATTRGRRRRRDRPRRPRLSARRRRRRSRRPRRDPRLRPRRRGPRRSGPRGVLRLDREMNERKGGGEDEAAAAGDDDAEDASAGAPARDDEVSRGASSTLPRSLVVRVTRDRLRVVIEYISRLRTVRYLNPYYVVPSKQDDFRRFSRNFPSCCSTPSAGSC